MKDIELPPLPKPDFRARPGIMGDVIADANGDPYYSADDIRDYARAAVEADRAQRVPDDFLSHRSAWRAAMVIAEGFAANEDDASYWRHELKAFDNAYSMLASTPAQPAQKPATSVPWMTARRAAYFMERFLHEEKMLGPNEQDALRFTIEALEAMATTHQEPPQQERKPMTELHINRGSADAAADLYAAEYWSARAQEKADSDRAKGALQPVSYYVRDAIMRLSATTESRSEPWGS